MTGGKTSTKPSMSGMQRTEVDNYSLCAIIDACSRGGVSSIKFRDVDIQFGRPQVQAAPDLTGEFFQPQTNTTGESVVYSNDMRPSFDEDLRKEMRLEQLLIDDPHGFEREIITSHLSG